jgi:transcriptional regulator with XRE-family HTH domain
MINSEDFSKRLKLIMETNEISATQFAEILDVQRSSISHLLSGRNKPSLEFVLKVLKNFKDVELYWLLNGTGEYPKQSINQQNLAPTLFNENTTKQKVEFLSTEKEPEALKNNVTDKNAEIERIIIFFKDGSFKNYSS